VDSFDAVSFKWRLARLFQVAFGAVSLSVTPGSVLVNATIQTDESDAAESAAATLRDSSPEALTVILGAQVEGVSSVASATVVIVPAPAPALPSPSPSTSQAVLAAVLSVLGTTALVGVLAACWWATAKRRKTTMPGEWAGADAPGKEGAVVVKDGSVNRYSMQL